MRALDVQKHTNRWKPFLGPLTLLAVGVMSLLHFGNLGHGSLHPWDECLYAIRGRYAFRGMWLDQMPYCYGPPGNELILGNGFYSGAFPPLLIWAIGLTMKFFGETSLAARIPAALAGTGCIWVAYLWGRHAWDRATGFLSAFTLASWFFFITYARRAQFDIPLVFFLFLTLYAGLRYYKDRRTGWLILGGFALGCGLMTKILICGFASVALLLFGLCLWLRGERPLMRVALDQVILNGIGIGLALPWHLYMILKYQGPEGNEFLKYFWGYHIAARSHTRLEITGPIYSWNYYFKYAFFENFKALWIFLMLCAVGWALWRWVPWMIQGVRRHWNRRKDEHPAPAEAPARTSQWSDEHAIALPLLWFLFVAFLTQMTATKRAVYIFPFLPALALLSARFLVVLARHGFPRWRQWFFVTGVTFLAVWWRSRSPRKTALALWNDSSLDWTDRLKGSLDVLDNEIALAFGLVAGLMLIVYLAPFLKRLPPILCLVVFIALGCESGLRHNFSTRAMREYDWSLVETIVKKGNFDSVVFLGQAKEPDLHFYLDGINVGWREGIKFQQIMRPLKGERTPLKPDPDRLVIEQRYQPDEPGLEDCLREDQAQRLLEHYELKAENKDFRIYRSR